MVKERVLTHCANHNVLTSHNITCLCYTNQNIMFSILQNIPRKLYESNGCDLLSCESGHKDADLQLK